MLVLNGATPAKIEGIKNFQVIKNHLSYQEAGKPQPERVRPQCCHYYRGELHIGII